jgi:hypothetical protein
MKKIMLVCALLLVASPHFLLSAQEKKAKTIVNEVTLPELTVIDNVLYIKNAPVGSHVEIITILGNKVKEIPVKSNNDSYELRLPRAIYIFKIEGIVRKFVIK